MPAKVVTPPKRKNQGLLLAELRADLAALCELLSTHHSSQPVRELAASIAERCGPAGLYVQPDAYDEADDQADA